MTDTAGRFSSFISSVSTDSGPRSDQIRLSMAGLLETITGSARWYPPATVTINSVRASVGTAPTGADILIDVNKNGSSILSGPVTVTAGSNASSIDTPAAAVATSADYFTVDIDQVGSTIAGSDLTVQIKYSVAGGTDSIQTGTFTPTYICRTTDFDSVSYDQQDGSYVKIGSLVYVYMNIGTSSITVGGATGPAAIGNLPFSLTNGLAVIGYGAGWGGDVPTSGYLFPSGILTLTKRDTSNGALTTMDAADFAVGATSNQLYISITGTTDD
jgi:hypothetical protein